MHHTGSKGKLDLGGFLLRLLSQLSCHLLARERHRNPLDIGTQEIDKTDIQWSKYHCILCIPNGCFDAYEVKINKDIF